MIKRKSIIFDLDGTLIDSAPDITVAVNRVMKGINGDSLSIEYVKRFIGDGSRSMLWRIFQDHNIAMTGTLLDEKLAAYQEFYRQAPAEKTRFFPHVEEDLEEFLRVGIRLGICTNKPDGLTKLVLSALGISHLFDVVLGADSVISRKPHRGHLLNVVVDMGVPAKDILYVGDTEIDRACAHSAGIPFFIVNWGGGQQLSVQNDIRINRLVDLLPYTIDERAVGT